MEVKVRIWLLALKSAFAPVETAPVEPEPSTVATLTDIGVPASGNLSRVTRNLNGVVPLLPSFCEGFRAVMLIRGGTMTTGLSSLRIVEVAIVAFGSRVPPVALVS